MSKLTLSIDAEVVARAKRYSKRRGISISKMVENYLMAVSRESAGTLEAAAPILQSVRGILKNGNVAKYRRHVLNK